jgi:hypothetical protein
MTQFQDCKLEMTNIHGAMPMEGIAMIVCRVGRTDIKRSQEQL